MVSVPGFVAAAQAGGGGGQEIVLPKQAGRFAGVELLHSFEAAGDRALRVPINSSRSLPVWLRWRCIDCSPAPNFSNSVLTAASTCHTSPERF